ncbi:methyltransferase domain-containing protein [Rhizobium sp. BK251]|uniref:methyltransferase domain-containing protein n=1 Tax=Rhizobium sp. BK251 TaxID=2512125 RepID=UPI001047FE75|nr:methyltransferase domain-containing protein [Rhizobium sp. BK251]TCL66379.1 methyltransferase family protein [Rhizobium sp. BK251]
MGVQQLRQHPELKDRLRTALQALGYETDDWVRVMMYRDAFAFIRELDPTKLDTLEISGGVQWRREFAFKSYRSTEYPGFDICNEVLRERFDLIIADQVFEHLKWPSRAARNVYAMLRPGGYFIIATPFLLRVHASPIDCNRWTETGLSFLLQEAGFAEDAIVTRSWGNRSCVKANFKRWPKAGFFGSLKNEANFPVMVWAYAQKPLEAAE